MGLPTDRSDALSDYITELLYDRRFVYEHTWMTGDFLVADNIEVGSRSLPSAYVTHAISLIADAYEDCVSALFTRVVADSYKLMFGIRCDIEERINTVSIGPRQSLVP